MGTKWWIYMFMSYSIHSIIIQVVLGMFWKEILVQRKISWLFMKLVNFIIGKTNCINTKWVSVGMISLYVFVCRKKLFLFSICLLVFSTFYSKTAVFSSYLRPLPSWSTHTTSMNHFYVITGPKEHNHAVYWDPVSINPFQTRTSKNFPKYSQIG